MAFPGGLTVSELPLHSLAWQAAATAGFVAAGGLRSRAGRAGLALTAASWAGLVGLDRVAARADDVLEAALVEGLGPDYRRRMAATFAPPEDVPITRRQVANPLPPLRRRYATTRDVPYGEHGRRNHLDVWRRADLADDAGAPVLVQVHGGAWVTGSKEQQGAALMGHLAERGWVSVAVNYRLAPRSTWPDQIVDVKRAIAWVKEHIAEYGGDPDFVVITGGSAGGHLSAARRAHAGERAFQPGFEDADTSVQAAIPILRRLRLHQPGPHRAGRHGGHAVPAGPQVTARRRPRDLGAGVPHDLGRPRGPAVLHRPRRERHLVPVEQARSFASMLRGASDHPVVYAELPRAQHAFDLFSSVRTAHPAGGRPVPRRRPHRPRGPCRPHRGCRTGGAGLVGGPDAMTTNRRLALAHAPRPVGRGRRPARGGGPARPRGGRGAHAHDLPLDRPDGADLGLRGSQLLCPRPPVNPEDVLTRRRRSQRTPAGPR